MLLTHPLFKTKEGQSQIEVNLLNSRRERIKNSNLMIFEVVLEWPYYMGNFNIPKH